MFLSLMGSFFFFKVSLFFFFFKKIEFLIRVKDYHISIPIDIFFQPFPMGVV